MKLNQKFMENKQVAKSIGSYMNIPLIRERTNQNFISQRFSISEAFKTYTWKIIPVLEEKLEEDLLRSVFEKIESESLREEMLLAYQRRRMSLEKEQFDSDFSFSGENLEDKTPHDFISVYFDNAEHTSPASIGYYCMFGLREFSQYYSKGFFGPYKKLELDETKLFALMNTKESNFLVDTLRSINQNFNQGVNFASVLTQNPTDAEFSLWIQNKKNYLAVVNILSQEFRKQIYDNRSEQFIVDKFYDSFLVDVMTNILVDKMQGDLSLRMSLLTDQGQREEFFSQLMQQILEKSDQDHTNFTRINTWLRDMRSLEFSVKRFDLEADEEGFMQVQEVEGESAEVVMEFGRSVDYLDYLPQELKKGDYGSTLSLNSGVMLYGTGGTGKSCALGYATNYAYRNNWLVIKAMDCHQLTQNGEQEIMRHEESRLYFQRDQAVEILEDFLHSNTREVLEKIPVNMDLYGKYNSSGCHDDEPAVVKNTYNEWRQAYFFDTDDLVVKNFREDTIAEQRYLRERLSERVRQPTSLIDIIEHGIEHKDWSINAVAEIMEQLYNLDTHKVLVAVDAYNDLFRKSVYLDYRYECDRTLRGYIPPYHMALARLFMRMDGHKIKNGFKIVASSNAHLYKHTFNPEKINFPEGFSIEMQNLDHDHIRSAIIHYGNTKKMMEDDIDEGMVQLMYLETQGNWGELSKVGYNWYLRGYIDKEWRNHSDAVKEDREKALNEAAEDY